MVLHVDRKKRLVKVKPFYLRLTDGKRIRVEPAGDVALVDAIDGIIRVDLTHRTRFAELSPGEQIYASGQLVRAPDPESDANAQGGYRSARETLVLRPLPKEPMLLSSEPLGARFRERAAFHARAARNILITAIAIHVALYGFHARRYLGSTEDAVLAKLDHYVTKDSDGDENDNYRAFLLLPDETIIVDRIGYDLFSRLQEKTIIPVRRVREPFVKQSKIGPGVTTHQLAWLIVPILFIAFRLYRYHEQNTRPWYERPLVDTGPGELKDSKPVRNK